MPQTEDTTQPRTTWLNLLSSSIAGDSTNDLGARIRRLAEHAAAEHLTANNAADALIDRPQPNSFPHPSTTGRHGRRPYAQHISESSFHPGNDHGTAAKECG
ncbi:MAG: hypothetical protein AAF797_05470 [Planctomycetota bacterium]